MALALPIGHNVVQAIQQSTNNDQTSHEWDVFICHASEDKEELVRPLAISLVDQGLRVWYDEFTITVGDSLRQSIDRGLARSRYGIVIISPNFLQKRWPQNELDGLVAREIEGDKVILPVWHKIGEAEIRSHSPILAGRFGVLSEKGIDHVINELLRAIRRDNTPLQQNTNSSGSIAEYTRNAVSQASNTGKQPSLIEHARDFHNDRIKELAAKNTPVAVLDGAMLILHLTPSNVVNEEPIASFDDINPDSFPPINGHTCDSNITYDGLLIGSNANGLREPQRAYVQVFRSGAIEAVVSSLAPRGYQLIELPKIQMMIIKYVYRYTNSLKNIGATLPITVTASLINVQGLRLLHDSMGNYAIPEDIPGNIINKAQLQFGHVILDTVPTDFNEGAKVLNPILTHMANAAGLSSSPYFDKDGNYTVNL